MLFSISVVQPHTWHSQAGWQLQYSRRITKSRKEKVVCRTQAPTNSNVE